MDAPRADAAKRALRAMALSRNAKPKTAQPSFRAAPERDEAEGFEEGLVTHGAWHTNARQRASELPARWHTSGTWAR
jgi:hypothetical protein